MQGPRPVLVSEMLNVTKVDVEKLRWRRAKTSLLQAIFDVCSAFAGLFTGSEVFSEPVIKVIGYPYLGAAATVGLWRRAKRWKVTLMVSAIIFSIFFAVGAVFYSTETIMTVSPKYAVYSRKV